VRRREPRCDGTRFAIDAEREAIPFHQLQDRRGNFRAGRSHRDGAAVRQAPGTADAGMMSLVSSPWAAAETIGASASELASFQEEPRQLKSGTAGKTGFLRLEFEHEHDRTVLANLERRLPYMVQRPLYCDEQMPQLPWVFIITSTGCVVQGDRLGLEVALGAG